LPGNGWFAPHSRHSGWNTRKITGRSDLYCNPEVRRKYLYVLKVLKVAV
jgi:hypothetical protein